MSSVETMYGIKSTLTFDQSVLYLQALCTFVLRSSICPALKVSTNFFTAFCIIVLVEISEALPKESLAYSKFSGETLESNSVIDSHSDSCISSFIFSARVFVYLL
ncbi:MAG: hypothetical protein KDH96_12435 [Candidatus Riesia sp.]|nr:hypothetical protein [Candidatus Riesia sp.]